MSKKVFIGTDSGATTTKLCAVWENGEPVSSKVLQRSTSSSLYTIESSSNKKRLIVRDKAVLPMLHPGLKISSPTAVFNPVGGSSFIPKPAIGAETRRQDKVKKTKNFHLI